MLKSSLPKECTLLLVFIEMSVKGLKFADSCTGKQSNAGMKQYAADHVDSGL